MNYLKKFLLFPPSDKQLLIEAIFYLYAAKILLLILPIKNCIQFFPAKNCLVKEWELEYLLTIKRAITRTNRLAIWKNVCLVQSIAARWILQHRKISSRLSIGVAHDKDKKLIAHAWIKVNNIEIVNKSLDYTELFSIV